MCGGRPAIFWVFWCVPIAGRLIRDWPPGGCADSGGRWTGFYAPGRARHPLALVCRWSLRAAREPNIPLRRVRWIGVRPRTPQGCEAQQGGGDGPITSRGLCFATKRLLILYSGQGAEPAPRVAFIGKR